MDDRLLGIIIGSFTKLLIPGLTVTIPLTLISFAIGLVLAIAVALVRVAKVPMVHRIAQFYVWVFRGTPLLVQLFVIFFGLPSVGIVVPAFPSALIAFSLNVGAYASETLRGAILAVPKGQVEAGLTTNLSYLTIMRLIVLPQAFRSAFPALFNTFISLVKDTSLAANITVVEMFMPRSVSSPPPMNTGALLRGRRDISCFLHGIDMAPRSVREAACQTVLKKASSSAP